MTGALRYNIITVAFAIVTFSFVSCNGGAASLTTLHDFYPAPNGDYIGEITQGPDGYLYGAASSGGGLGGGTVFRLSLSGQITIIHTFVGAEYEFPATQVVMGDDGYLYGTMVLGNKREGSVYRIAPNGDLSSLCSFGPGNRSGDIVVDPNGGLYGVVSPGFRFDGYQSKLYHLSETGAMTVLQVFNGGVPSLVLNHGNLYGITTTGGSGGEGMCFEVATDGSTTEIHAFSGPDGSHPADLTRGDDGNLYGITNAGGANGFGTIFSIDPAGVLSTLYSFRTMRYDNYAQGLLEATDGNVYLESVDEHDTGRILKLGRDGTLSFLPIHGSTVGRGEPGGLIQGTDGNLYGTNVFGKHSVYQLDLSGVLKILYTFPHLDGACPTASLVQANDRKFYGSTYLGGADSGGNVFSVTATGEYANLYSFSPDSRSFSTLLQGLDGNLYGTVAPSDNLGTNSVFRVDTYGMVKTVAQLPGIVMGLSQDLDGFLYGGISSDSSDPSGQIFKMSTNGDLSILYSLSAPDVQEPESTQLRASNGDIYGITMTGNIFHLTTRGNYTVLHSLTTDPNEIHSWPPLMWASDGNMYGAAPWSPRMGAGYVYRLTPDGDFKIIHSFYGYGGNDYPICQLVQGLDGQLYGTTVYNTVFRMTLDGTLTTLYTFHGADGMNPEAGLCQGDDGNFYGLTTNGGAHNAGTIFKLDAVHVAVSGLSSASGQMGSELTIFGDNFSAYPITNVLFDTAPANFTVISDSQIEATVPVGAITGLITVTNAVSKATSATFTVLHVN